MGYSKALEYLIDAVSDRLGIETLVLHSKGDLLFDRGRYHLGFGVLQNKADFSDTSIKLAFDHSGYDFGNDACKH